MSNQRPVRNYMTPLPHTIGAEQSLASASRRMSQLGVRHLPVLQGGLLCGVVSERDILFLRSHTGIDPERTSVEEAMSAEPFVVGPEMPIGAVARSMSKRRIGSVVVVEGQDVVGILTTTDALAILADVVDSVGIAPAPPALVPSVVRVRVLEEHVALRGLLATMSSLAERVLDTDNALDEELPLQAREVYRALIRHLDLEDLILAPALRSADAWGEVRADALVAEHRRQREQFRAAFADQDGGGSVKLASGLLRIAPLILEDMAHEEEELLTEALLGDDVAMVAPGA
ncbi:MAG: CBS domain-containing protein [Polyangiales bacterium]